VYMYVYVYMYDCVYVSIYIYIRARVVVHMHSCRRILSICTVQSLYYMRVYYRCQCFLKLACVCGGGLEVGFVSACSWLALVTGVGVYVFAGVEIVLDVSPGVGRTPGEPEEPRSTKAHYTWTPYRCTQYICLHMCCAAGFDDLG